MSNLIFNIRFGARHFQISRDPFGIKIITNMHWVEHPPEKWFAVYTWFGTHYD